MLFKGKLCAINLIILIIFIFPTSAFSHGGGLDSSGCHNDRKRGGYHCHGDAPAPEVYDPYEGEYEDDGHDIVFPMGKNEFKNHIASLEAENNQLRTMVNKTTNLERDVAYLRIKATTLTLDDFLTSGIIWVLIVLMLALIYNKFKIKK